jgi:adenylate cyclase 9
VLGKRQDLVNSLNNSKTNLFLSPNDGFMDNVKLSRSVTNISGMTPTVPPSSPLGPISTSLNPSPVLTTRPRIASFSKVSKLLSSKCDTKEPRDNGCKKLSNASITACPKIVINVNDDDHEVVAHNEHDLEGGDTTINDCLDDSQQHSKSSTLAGKLINWKISNFLLKKADNGTADNHTIVCSNTLGSSCSSNEHNNDCDIPSNTKQQQSEDVPFLDQNGYQQLPIVIESEVATPTLAAVSTTTTTSNRPNCHTLELPNPHMGLHRTSSAKYSGGHHHHGHGHETAASLLSQSTMFDDVIDIRSYISQSRSDISPFNRSGSYRSQSGRGGGGGGHHQQVPAPELSPTTGRPRSSTLHSPSVDYTGRERSCNLLGKFELF